MGVRTGKHISGYTTYGRSDKYEFAIAAGQVTRTDAINLKRNYRFIRVVCDGSAGIDQGTKLTAKVANDADSPLNPLWQANGAAVWESGALPTTGFDFMLSHADGIQRIQFALDAAANQADVILYVYGLDPAAI
jgi:hypothetical protein